jgi:hypothetical protein
VEHPEGPGGKPAVAFLGGDGEDFFFEEPAEHGAVVTFVDAGYGNGELEVFDLVEADVDGVREVVCEKEEGSGVFCHLLLVNGGKVGQFGLPKRRLLIKAYAFFNAAVRHFGSSKLFDKKRNVAPCSRFQVAMRHSPWRTVFFFSAR